MSIDGLADVLRLFSKRTWVLVSAIIILSGISIAIFLESERDWLVLSPLYSELGKLSLVLHIPLWTIVCIASDSVVTWVAKWRKDCKEEERRDLEQKATELKFKGLSGPCKTILRAIVYENGYPQVFTRYSDSGRESLHGLLRAGIGELSDDRCVFCLRDEELNYLIRNPRLIAEESDP